MRIKFLNTDLPDRIFDEQIITVGREEDNILCLSSDGISRHHGRIFRTVNGLWFVEDLGSTNGISVNGTRISEPYQLAENDVVAFYQDKIQIFEISSKDETVAVTPVSTDTAKISISDVIPPSAASEISVTPIVQIEPENTAISFAPAEPAPESGKEKEPELEKLAEFIHQNTSSLFKNDKKQKSNSNDENKDTPKHKFSNKLFYVTLVCAIIVIGAFLIRVLDDKNAPSKSVKNVNEVQDYPICITYIKENITKDNVFRFELVIENGLASFSVDDLKSQLRYGPIVKPVNDVELAKLKQTVKDSQFMNLKEIPDGIMTNNEREYKELNVFCGAQNKRIILKNRPAPREFLDIEEAINIFAESCNMATFSLSPEELRQQAESHYRSAVDKFANHEINLSYLKEAVSEFNIVIEYLSGITPEPKIRRDAAEKMKRAADLRTKFIQRYRSQYLTSLNQNDINGARSSLQTLLDLYDVNSKEYLNTKRRLIKIDMLSRRIQSQKGR